MKILKYIGLGIAVIIVILSIIPVFLSSSTKVTRSVNVTIPADSAFAYLSDFKNFKEWSPWQEKDPNMVTTIEGSGTGSKYSWQGNDQVGSGSMTISAIEPGKSVSIQLEFLTPFKSNAFTKWTVEPAEGGSTISWEMSQDLSYGKRYFGLCMDAMIGPDFEKGLSKLKSNLEK